MYSDIVDVSEFKESVTVRKARELIDLTERSSMRTEEGCCGRVQVYINIVNTAALWQLWVKTKVVMVC